VLSLRVRRSCILPSRKRRRGEKNIAGSGSEAVREDVRSSLGRWGLDARLAVVSIHGTVVRPWIADK
jgi:hypothetical protein